MNRLPARLARTIEVLVQLGVAFFGAYLALGGWGYVAETLTSFSAAIASAACFTDTSLVDATIDGCTTLSGGRAIGFACAL